MPSFEERRRLSGRYDKAHGFAGGNDEPTAATTQIVAGPTGSEIDLTAGSAFHRPDADDAFGLWNLAPLPPDQPFTRVFKGRGELIDHLFASHRLVNPANLPPCRRSAAWALAVDRRRSRHLPQPAWLRPRCGRRHLQSLTPIAGITGACRQIRSLAAAGKPASSWKGSAG